MFVKLVFISGLVNYFVASSEINIFPSLPIIVEKSDNHLCNQENRQYLNSLENFTLWAHEMRDASAQSATSVLRGNGFSLGNPKQCLSARAPFVTRYCMAIITANVPETKTPRDPFSLDFDPYESIINKLYKYEDQTKQERNIMRMGWCFPASCSETDAETFLNVYLKNYDHPLKKENVTFTAVIPSVVCQSSNTPSQFDGLDISFCVLVASLIAIVIVATVLERKSAPNVTRDKTLSWRMLMTFAATKNFKKLGQPDDGEKPLKILYGLKAISISIIVISHRGALFGAVHVISYEILEEFYRNPYTTALYRADFFVDTFFFIGGLLLTYILLGVLEKNNYKPGLLLLNRYCRLGPAYFFMIFFHASILYHTGNGALWESIIGGEKSDCRENWWTGVLYVSNLVNPSRMCIAQSWFLSCEFHFFIVGLLLIYLLHKNRNIGFIAVGLCIVATMVTTFCIIYFEERTAFLRFLPTFLSAPKMDTDYVVVYIKSYTRGVPYFVGMIAGYIYYKLKGTDHQISLAQKRIMVTSSFVLLSVLMLTGVIFYNPYHPYNALESAFYGAFNRLIWAIGNFCFVYAVSFGPHGFFYKLLAWKVFIPISKLAYGIFLWHMAFQLRDIASRVSSREYNIFDVFLMWMSDFALASLLSLWLHVTVEAPFKNLIRIMFSQGTSAPTKVELPIKISLGTEGNTKF